MSQNKDKLMVVDFYATWCLPCRKMHPQLKELATGYPNVAFYNVDVDMAVEIAEQYNVNTIPKFIFIREKKVIDEYSGSNIDEVSNRLQVFSKHDYALHLPKPPAELEVPGSSEAAKEDLISEETESKAENVTLEARAEVPAVAAKSEAAKPEAAKPEAVKPEAVKPEAVKPEAAKLEAVKPEAVKPEALKHEPVKHELVRLEPVQPEAVKPQPPVRPEPVKMPEVVKPEPVKPEPVRPEPVKTEPVKPEPVKPEPVQPEAVRPQPLVKPEPVKMEPMKIEAMVPIAAVDEAASKAKDSKALKKGDDSKEIIILVVDDNKGTSTAIRAVPIPSSPAMGASANINMAPPGSHAVNPVMTTPSSVSRRTSPAVTLGASKAFHDKNQLHPPPSLSPKDKHEPREKRTFKDKRLSKEPRFSDTRKFETQATGKTPKIAAKAVTKNIKPGKVM